MAQSKRSIIVFTRWFPYNKVLEQSFLLEELRVLCEHFSHIYVVPQEIESEKYEGKEKFIVDESLARQYEKPTISQKIRAIVSMSFIKELFVVKFDRLKIKYAIAMRLGGVVTEDWIKKFVSDKSDVVLYSFWLDKTAYGSVLSSSKNIIKRVARCHNYDLYGNEENKFYVPFRTQMVQGLDVVLPDSFEGEQFLKRIYPNASVEVGIMGTADHGNTNIISEDDTLRIISCAYMIPRKRVLLFAKALKELNSINPEFKIHWIHVGEGEEIEFVRDVIKELGSSITIDLKGNLSTEDLKDLYDKCTFDLFVNTSTKEGTPVAIIEAISRGIPLMATAFGGGKEIVEAGAGILMSNDPEVEEIVQKILGIRKEDLVTYSARSREIWERNYSSVKNYTKFCQLLDQD